MNTLPKVLVVDDEPRNLNLVVALLASLDLEVITACGGQEAIDVFRTERPDLVLLDVMMPEVDGLTALGEMRRATAVGEHVPIVLVTALTEREDRIRGLEAGADDFLTKPLDPSEVRCRVRTFLQLRAMQNALKARAEQLEQAQRAKAELTALIVHDLKNPLSGVVGNLQWVSSNLRRPTTAPGDVDEALDDAQSASQRLLALVQALVDVEKAESGQLQVRCQPTALGDVVAAVVRRQNKAAAERGVALTVEAEPGTTGWIDLELVTRVLENLVDNALRYAGKKGRIAVQARMDGDAVELAVANTGTPIPAELRARVFDKSVTTEARRTHGMNLGLGLYFCRLATLAHHGEIRVESTPSWPTRFVLRLPAAPRASLAPAMEKQAPPRARSTAFVD